MPQAEHLSSHLVPNCFDPDVYYVLDVRQGVMRNRFGAKCCTFSAHALRGIFLTLKDEVGPAWRSVARGEIVVEEILGRHIDMMRSPAVDEIAANLRPHLLSTGLATAAHGDTNSPP